MASVVHSRQSALETVQPMPPLSDAQLDALRQDIAENGVLVPVTVDQRGRISDGNNRAAIATELGIDYPTVRVEVADDEAAVDLALTLNCARRHLTQEQKRELIRSEIARRPNDSDRPIARRVGSSATTVGAVRKSDVEVSNLDAPVMTREAAEKVTEDIRQSLLDGRAAVYALVSQALVNGVSVTEVVGALTMARMSYARRTGDPEVIDLWCKLVFDYVAEVATWPETAEQFPVSPDATPTAEVRAFFTESIVMMGSAPSEHPADHPEPV